MQKPTKDLTDKVGTFFAKRNGIKPEVVYPGYNFDADTLTYTTPPTVADGIRDTIIAQYKALGYSGKFFMIDANGSMGGTTLSFLDAPKDIWAVLTFEPQAKYANMLRRNIQSYGEGFSSRSIVVQGYFDESFGYSAYAGGAIFYDPPWLPAGIAGSESTRDQYILEGMKLGAWTLEQHLQAARVGGIYSATFHLPPGYKLGAVEGWEMKPTNRTNKMGVVKGIIIYCTCVSNAQYIPLTYGGYKTISETPSIGTLLVKNWTDPEPKPTSGGMSTAIVKAVEGIQLPTIPTLPTLPTGTGIMPTSTFLITEQEMDARLAAQRQASVEAPPARIVIPSPGRTIQSIQLPIPGAGAKIQLPIPPQGATLQLPIASVPGNSPPPTDPMAKFTKGGRPYQGLKRDDYNVGTEPTSLPVASVKGGSTESVPKIISGAKWPTFCATLPTYKKGTQLTWEEQFQAYIYRFLRGFTTEEIALEMVTYDAMQIWIKAFTHETFDPRNNYEELETIGDAVLKVTFRMLLFERFGGKISPKTISSFETYYMSKPLQAEVSLAAKFPMWARINSKNKLASVQEDLMESLFGCLMMLGNLRQPGFGFELSLQLLRKIYEDVEISENIKHGNAKTVVQQTVLRLGWVYGSQTLNETYSDVDGIITCVVEMPDAGITWLRTNGYDVFSPLGEGQGKSNHAASASAYADANTKLIEIGLDKDTVDKIRSEMDLVNYDPQLVAAVKAKAFSEYGTDYISFYIPRTTQNRQRVIVQLIAIEVNGSRHTLVTAESNDGNTEEIKQTLRERVLHAYLTEKTE